MWKYGIGKVVLQKETLADRPMFGHVIGFDRNHYETILIVRWEDGSETTIHPANVITEEDF